jgi:hypothetical protein
LVVATATTFAFAAAFAFLVAFGGMDNRPAAGEGHQPEEVTPSDDAEVLFRYEEGVGARR